MIYLRKAFHGVLFILQICTYYVLYPLAMFMYGNKRVWVICERGDDARDNGYWLFKHLSSEHPYVNQYYLIKKRSSDYEKVKNLGKVAEYKNFKHWLLYIAAEVRATSHLAAFAPGNFIGEYFKYHRQSGVNVFLNHGVNHNDYPSNYYKYNCSDLFICGAFPEYKYFLDNYGYNKSNIVYTGLARFDGLHNFSTKKQILIMPTWRKYLFSLSNKDFLQSKYFISWSDLLKNKKFLECCMANNINVVFYLHYSLQHFISCFDILNNRVVHIASFHEYDVQALLKESSLLITDYSSVFFDFAYMKKPQLFFQFDENDFYSKHYSKGYFSHKKDGFGEVADNADNLIESCISIINNNFCLNELYLKRVNDFFPINDKNNSERIYQAITKVYICKKKHKCSIPEENIIITGDDYGRYDACSKGIEIAFKKGYINHTSVIVNNEERFSLSSKFLDVFKTGLHINLTEGYCSYAENDALNYSVNDPNSISFKELNTKRAYFWLSKKAKSIISKEVRAQCEIYLNLGFKAIYFDSHGHIHTKMPIAKIIVPIMKEYGFTHARIPSNVSKRHFLFNWFYKSFVIKLYKKNFVTTDFFASCDDFIHIKSYRKFNNKTIEIMTHPYLIDDNLYNRRDIDFDVLCYEVYGDGKRFVSN